MYLKIVNDQIEIYSIEQLRSDNPNTSFPKVPNEELLAEWGVYAYTVQDQPEINHLTQMAVATQITKVDGVWVQGWKVENLPLEDAGRNVRYQRNSLLSQTDWMALSDNTMTPEWAAYRQSLRDVTSQVGFPYSVIWPVKPE